MRILEYLLESGRCPSWVEDGGYFKNPADSTMIGATRDNPGWELPSTATILTAQQLEDRQVAIHNITPMIKHPDEPGGDFREMTEAEVRTAVQNWIAER
jgi:hypothetical protein